jgi:multidrug efflux pump subunit AcrA (membrane-fusion protein)
MSEEKEIIETKEFNEENPKSSGAKNWLIGGVIGLLLLGLLGYYAWNRISKPAEVAKKEAEKNETGKVKFLMEQQWLIKMKLAKAEKETVSRQVTSVGRVVPAANSQAVVSTPVAGILSDRQLPRIGQYVGGGQQIAFIRQTPTSTELAQTRAAQSQVELSRAQIESQKAQLELQKNQIEMQKIEMEVQNSQIEIENARLETEKRTATGEVETARVRLEAAKREADRMQRLFDGKAASQKQLQNAQSERESAQVAYDSSVKQRDGLANARPVKPRQINVSNPNFRNISGSTAKITNVPNGLTISAPFGGYVTKVNKSIGEQVSPGDAIIEISNLDTVYVEAPIFERDLNTLGTSRTATFKVAAYDEEFTGTVLDFGSTIDEQTRAANVIFQVNNAGRALRLGMQANVRLNAEQTATAMLIPKEAIIEAEGKKLVYVLDSGEEFERREVTVGDEYGDKVAVLTGIEEGERVVTQGAYQIRLQELKPAEDTVHSHET